MAAHFHKSSAGPGGGDKRCGRSEPLKSQGPLPSPPPKAKEAKRHARRAVKRPGPYLVPWANY